MFNRNLSTTALALLTLAVSACAPNAGNQPPLPSPTATAGGNATPAPGGSATPAPGESAQPTPGASAPASGGRTVIVSGMVYDDAGAPVEGATVAIRSLVASVPYEATVNSNAGSWVVNNVPDGVNVEVKVTKAGWTSRTRVASFQGGTAQTNVVDFGGKAAGMAYFISDYPEIMATAPATKATGVDAAQLSYQLTLSEPLNDANRKRFEDALRLFPANAAANPGATPADLTDVDDATAVNVDADYAYAIKKGTVFLEDTQTAATVAWSADGLTATVGFKAPLIAAKNDEAMYQVGLVRVNGSTPRIEDAGGKQLGTDAAGSHSAYPAAPGDLIRNVFRAPNLTLDSAATTAAARWNGTHDSVATFEVKKDATKPVLSGLAVNEIGNDTRIELTFSEPMAAYDGTATGLRAASLLDLANYTFMVGETAEDLDGELDGDNPVSADPKADGSFGDASADREKEFRFVDGDGVNSGSLAGDIKIEIDPRDAKHVWITVIGRKDYFDADLGAIKARVEGVADPAGNAIGASDADKNVVSATL